jgi:hypothetical protein
VGCTNEDKIIIICYLFTLRIYIEHLTCESHDLIPNTCIAISIGLLVMSVEELENASINELRTVQYGNDERSLQLSLDAT